MLSNPFAEAHRQGSIFQICQVTQGEAHVNQCLACQGEGYDGSNSLTSVQTQSSTEDQMWLVTAMFPDGSFKLGNVLFDLRLCAHRRMLRNPIAFCHPESSNADQVWRCESVQQIASEEDPAQLSVKALRAEAARRGLDSSGCVEKSELVALVRGARPARS